MGDPGFLLKIAIFSILQKALAAHHKMAVAASLPTYGIAPGAFSLPRRTSAHASTSSPRGFDVIAAYQRALEDQEVDDNPTLLLSFPCSDASGVFQVPHPIAAILSLVELMETSTASTVTGLATELTLARQLLVDTQPSLGVRAGCQLWERFFALSGGGQVDSSPFLLPYDKERFEAEEPELMGRQEFPAYKRSLISQGRSFCAITAPQCREKIAALAVDFLRDDCTVRFPSAVPLQHG